MPKVKPRGIYPSYHFTDHDPVLDEIFGLVDQLDIALSRLAYDSGVTLSTLRNWRERKTKRPQFATVKAVVRAMGADLVVSAPTAAARRRAMKVVGND